MEKDVFCKINDGELDSNLVYEDELLKVIIDKFPNSPGHMLIIPKRHVNDALDIDDETFRKMQNNNFGIEIENVVPIISIEVLREKRNSQELFPYSIV